MKIDIFGTAVCGNCRKLEALLNGRNIPYNYSTIGKDITIEEIADIIDYTPRTVPIILINDEERTLDELKVLIALGDGDCMNSLSL